MNKQQFSILAMAIKSAYPASKTLEDNASMDLWFMLLKDIPYEVAKNAVMEHICTSVYPPNIAEIRKLCAERCHKSILSFGDAWEIVCSAITRYGTFDADRAFAKMDELTLSVVKNLGWRNLCLSENQAADRANFREIYESKAKFAQNAMQLPEFVANEKEQIHRECVKQIRGEGETNELPEANNTESLQDCG